ncbi:MAG: CvpA family protein [Thermoflexales bacterium]|nr:CvpA family protein [Thermoflexales bacterium]
MINADVVFIVFVLMFGAVGAVRGWVREVLVTFSMIFGLFVVNQFNKELASLAGTAGPEWKWFWRAAPFVLITFFGYLGGVVTNRKVEGGKRDAAQSVLAIVLGLLNGFILFSSLAYFAWQAGVLTNGNFVSAGKVLFSRPEAGWDQFFFVKNSAATFFSGPGLTLVLIAFVLFILIVII